MRLLQPTLPPYDPIAWAKLPLPERGRQACESWALQGYGSPIASYGFYVAKIALYIGGWLFFCGFSPDLGWPSTLSSWALKPLAFQKAILWSMLFEGLGLGCGSGPLTGRFIPPFGGVLYFLRPGTTKLPLFPRAPLIGGTRRTILDVTLYLALVVALVRALVAPSIDATHLWPIAVLPPVIGLLDKTIFLALRSEHFWITALCFLFAGNWIAGAKAVQLALWFFAGFSKMNHHFPAVVCVMTSNSPFTRFEWLRRLMYRRFPDDLRPSTLAVVMSHCGTALELGVPLILLFSRGGTSLQVGLVLMVLLHSFITSNVPMGVPIEWNIVVVYGAFALFGMHPDVAVWDLGSAPMAGVLAIAMVGVPLAGNLFPHAVSFLLSMRYYAGNWPYSVWLFKGDSYRKLDKIPKTSGWIYDQLGHMYDRPTSVAMVGKALAFRMMHLHGRALPLLIPKAVDRLDEYEWVEGELVAGMVLGWNFGDGHLHNEDLLRAVQEQCGFEAGELRCVFVESQPLGRSAMGYRIHDAKTGLIEAGQVEVPKLLQMQPWAA